MNFFESNSNYFDLFDVLLLFGGLAIFMFGMNIMGQALERSAGNKLQGLLGKLTTNKMAGFATGLGVTAVIQSSSATTVMVVGFVNSGVMTLKQAINVIMGANIGTTVTAWLLQLNAIGGGDNAQLEQILVFFKPMSWTPILGLIGIGIHMFAKSSFKKDIGSILLGFTTLMFGMDIMSDSVSVLSSNEAFKSLFTMFANNPVFPIIGVLVGAIVTGIIQSSSASVGILQALSSTGAISNAISIPIIMGQNIGTCVTALLSSVGTNKNAKRTSFVHLMFNVIGTVLLLSVYWIVWGITRDSWTFWGESAENWIPVFHSAFNIVCTAILLPCSSLLEKLAYAVIKDDKKDEKDDKLVLDERLLNTPAAAITVCHNATVTMAKDAIGALYDSLDLFKEYSKEKAEKIRQIEDKTDHYEDVIGTYLVKLSSREIGDQASDDAAKYLHLIGDFERISDHAVNLLESIEELKDKKLEFTLEAQREIAVLCDSVKEILQISLDSFINNDLELSLKIEPLEQVIDNLKEALRTRHIARLQGGFCTIEAGFIWSDILTNLERTSDHCSNIGACIIDASQNRLDLHETVKAIKDDSNHFATLYEEYINKYALPVFSSHE
ncbi:MAG: Na/Pi cotransporter family protein [Clostridia bacterium]|nr:Na/Pi cotransporter family protein [Clostridia bacterium]